MKLRWWNDGRGSLAVGNTSFGDQAMALGPRPVPIGGPGTEEVWNGTSGDDTKNGTNNDDTLNGLAGNDIINGKAGNDDITGGANNDELSGGDGNDTLRVGNGTDKAYGGKGDDLIKFDAVGGVLTEMDGGKGIDTFDVSGFSGASWNVSGAANIEIFILSNFNDEFGGLAGNETYNGGAGDDRLYGGLGNDIIDGDGAFDLAIFNSTTTGVNANLTTGKANGEGKDTLVDIEGLLGSSFNDKLTGDGNTNHFAGFEGDDEIDGKGGIDTVFYNSLVSGNVTVNLKTGVASGALGNDTLTDIERAAGGGGNDNLTGSDLDNVLWGGGGNDDIFGGDGNDQLVGDLGNDTLTGGRGGDSYWGGGGDDNFIFKPSNGLPVTSFINDATANETVDLSAIDAISGGGDQAFIVVESFTGAPGQARVDFNGTQTIISLDINGGAGPQAEYFIVIHGNHILPPDPPNPEAYDLNIIW
jgi:Ca2+-binding RTX toxin-like protein